MLPTPSMLERLDKLRNGICRTNDVLATLNQTETQTAQRLEAIHQQLELLDDSLESISTFLMVSLTTVIAVALAVTMFFLFVLKLRDEEVHAKMEAHHKKTEEYLEATIRAKSEHIDQLEPMITAKNDYIRKLEEMRIVESSKKAAAGVSSFSPHLVEDVVS